MKNIAVIFGGKSAEHDISIITAHTPIIKTLEAGKRYNIYPIYIAKDGAWYSDLAMKDLDYFRGDDLEVKLKKLKKINLSFDDGLSIIWSGLRDKKVKIDLVFPSMHGTFGEDGSLMGLLRLANVPFVGCDLFASAVAMDKALTKQVLASDGVPVTPFVWFTRSDWAKNKSKLKDQILKLEFPVFVKPVHLGSSIAITKVDTPRELENAIEVALHYDEKVLVENSVKNLIEVTLPIMGNDELQLAEIERPLNNSDFLDFNDKYMSDVKKGDSGSQGYSEIPAKIDKKLAQEARKLGEQTYRILGCSGIARVDFLIDAKASKVYVNEVNTLPGSLYHHNWKKAGVSNFELIDKLIGLAEERFAYTAKSKYSFKSTVLKHINGSKIARK